MKESGKGKDEKKEGSNEDGPEKEAKDDPSKSEEISQEDFQRALTTLEVYKNKLEAMNRDLEKVGSSKGDHTRAIETLEKINEMEEPGEVLVPVGGGTFVQMKPLSLEHVILQIGSGVSAEYGMEKALDWLGDRVDKLEDKEKELVTQIQDMEQKAQSLSNEVEAMYRKLQGQ